jgi:hypothetical protein
MEMFPGNCSEKGYIRKWSMTPKRNME